MTNKEKILKRIAEIEHQFNKDNENRKINELYGMDGLQQSYLEGQLTALKDVLYDRLYK